MTAPHQSPNQGMLEKWLGSGAFEVGGGDFNWGQDYDEQTVRALFEIPVNALNAFELLEEQLLKLPPEALKVFAPLIPDAVEEDFLDTATAVAKILDSLSDLPVALLKGEFDEWVEGTFETLSVEVRQIIDILAGLVVTPINGAVQAVKDWWTAIGGKTSGLDASGQLDASKLKNMSGFPVIGKDKVDGLTAELQGLAADVQEALANSAQQLRDQLTGIVNATPADVDNWLLDLLTGDSTIDAAKLTNLANMPQIGQDKVAGLASTLSNFLTAASTLDASKLTGLISAGLIPTLDQSKINGLAQTLAGFLTPQSNLDASKLTNMASFPTIPDGISKIADLQALVDAATNALSGATSAGSETVGVPLPSAKSTMANLFDMLTKVTRDVQTLKTEQEAGSIGGRRFNIDFSNYPDGAFPAGLFNLTYSGPGTSTLAVKSGNGTWNFANNGYRRATMIYPTPTLTPQQIVKGTLSSAPSQGTNVRIWSIARANAAGTDYVFARGYRTGFLSYKGDIGCVKNGVEYIWAQGVSLTWSLDLRIVCGVGENPRRHQVYSGNTVVIDMIEPANMQSIVDDNHCYWGAVSETDGQRGPGNVAGASVADNAPPAVTGTTMRVYRSSTSDSSTKASGTNVLPANTLDAVDYRSSDITWNASTQTATVEKAGTYVMGLRLKINDSIGWSGHWHPVIYINGALRVRMGQRAGISANGFGVPSASTDDSVGGDGVMYYLPAGATVRPGLYNSGDVNIVGGADTSDSWFSMVRVG
ncbi:minor tail subunit [Mycobacterium phage Trike]|uniref:minor tail protein n=1 Tax=Mycobacterium phage Trike TaxID=1527536 RepID=UPI0004EF872C|nr:minor tail protein [Mycobacterium phage Trike]AIK69069.1 minor tail subunit [Mycobacterium phage Trike]